jgi:hypothetical protein
MAQEADQQQQQQEQQPRAVVDHSLRRRERAHRFAPACAELHMALLECMRGSSIFEPSACVEAKREFWKCTDAHNQRLRKQRGEG